MSSLLPPQPLPPTLWGDQWRFLAIAAQDLLDALTSQPMRFRHLPEERWPLPLGLAADLPIPGVIIYGGRQSRALGQWLMDQEPQSVIYVADDPQRSGGLVLNAADGQRWIMTTFADPEMATAAAVFSQRKQKAKGLHFLWIQPDDTGFTSTGAWLLRAPSPG